MSIWKKALEAGLNEDQWQWDWTALGSLKSGPLKSVNSNAVLVAKSNGIWAADGLTPAAISLSGEMGGPVQIKSFFKDADRVRRGDVIQEWKGSTRSILALERPFLNLAAYVCGIATRTQHLVHLVEKAAKKIPLPRVTMTRKTLPGYRDLAILGVLAGGGLSHRVSLAAGVLIKENHITAAGGIDQAIEGVRKVIPHGLKLEIEVRTLDELQVALRSGAEVVLLDNFSPSQVRAAMRLISKLDSKILVEVSGGLDESNISKYVVEGVHVLSCGSLTHSVRAMDLSLLLK